MRWRALIAIALLAVTAPAYGTPPEQLYTLNCWGCHQPQAQGIPGIVPRLANSMGYFLHVPEGRAYLAEVPGVAAAPLSDQEVAQVLNWMLTTFSKDQLPEHFAPYTAEEIRKCRIHKLVNVTDTRRHLAAKLRSMGLKVADGEQAGSAAPAPKPKSSPGI